MAIKLIRTEYANELKDYTKEFIADTNEDADNLPKSAPGSTCIVVKSASVRIVGADGEWKPFSK